MITDLQSIEVLNAIYSRRAIRRYTDRALDDAEISKLIDAAIQAPSAMNQQAWAFAIVRGKSRLDDYSAQVKAYYRAQMGDVADHVRSYFEHESVFHGAPALVIVCATSASQQAAEDCCLAAENLMLAAFAHGLGTCPIGLARPWLALPETKTHLGIPSEFAPIFPVIIGEPNENPKGPGRVKPRLVWL